MAAAAWCALATALCALTGHCCVFLTLGIGVMLVSAVRASRQAIIPLWADHLLLAPSVASLIDGLAAGIDMLVFYPAGHVMDRKGRGWVAVPSMLIMGLALLLMSGIGATCGPALLSFLVATSSLAAAIAATGLVSFAAAAQLAWWIPRAGGGKTNS